jgi:chromosome segregation ATPase
MAPAAVFVLLLAMHGASATEQTGRANPIRKVVTMLQNVQKKVEAEGKRDEELFEKYMCYCKSGVGTLEKGIADAEARVVDLESSIKGDAEKKNQLEQDLKANKADREAAKKTLAEATALREKEAKAFAAYKAESETNIAATKKAVAALEAGMDGGAFVQVTAANAVTALRSLIQKNDMADESRQALMAFLQGSDASAYAPQSGQITGILKQMGDEMETDLRDASEAEAKAVADFEGLTNAKKREIAALTKSIEEMTARSGELAVGLAEKKNDLEDTKDTLAEDQKFLADLQQNCGTREKEWDGIQKTRSEELIALSDTIKLLNDDDALDLFKKTLPSASSFIQMDQSADSLRARALQLVHGAQRKHGGRPGLDFIALALSGKKAGFDKVVALIDNLVASLKQEQKNDDEKKAHCETEFDVSDDKKKGLEREIADTNTAMEAAKETIAALTDEIEAISAGITALDKAVAEATEQRKEENAAYKKVMAESGAAKELINIAKNRMNKFYNPRLYKAPPKRELSEEDRITVNMGGTLAATQPPGGIAGTGITAFAQAAPPAAPEAPGAFKKKTEESNGVIAMMDILVQDLDKEMTVSETEEKHAQAEYERTMKDSAAKRAADSKSLDDKETAKADADAALQGLTGDKAASEKELAATLKYIQSLHADCDWLLKYFQQRVEARASEVDALGKARAVLNGADYSFIQAGTVSRHLRGEVS